MADPWAHFADAHSDPYAQFHDAPSADPPKPQPQAPAKPKPNGWADAARQYVGGVLEGASGFGDMVMQAGPVGMIAGGLNTAASLAQLGGQSKSANVTPAPFSIQTQAATRATPPAQTTGGRYARSMGQMTPNALAPGGAVRRVANVVLPAVGSQSAGDAVESAGGNALAIGAARVAGALGGAAVSSLSPNALRLAPSSPDEVAAQLLAKRSGANAGQMQASANALSESGVEPTLIDVSGDRGRRLIRAVGVKNDQAGEMLATNARSVSSTAKPAIMARTQGIGPHQGMTADELVASLFKARDDAATTNYADAYQTQVPLDESVIAALSDAPGKAALSRAMRAAVARRDDQRVAEIQSLLDAGKPMPVAPPTPSPMAGLRSVKNTTSLAEPGVQPRTYPAPETVSAATLDRTQIALRNQAERLRRNQGGDIASGLTSRQHDINASLDAVPELAPARADYRAKSQALGVLDKERKDVFSTDPQDYGRWLESLSPEARAANQVAIRQEILDTLGGQRSSTFGTVDDLATSEYAKANLAQALGDQAGPYLANLEARLQQVRNARMVDPNAGSRTAVLQNDLNGLKTAAHVGGSALRGDLLGAAGKLGMWFLGRGVNEQQAQALAEAAVDPQRLQQVIDLIGQRQGPQAAQEFLSMRNALMAGGALTAGAAGNAPAH